MNNGLSLEGRPEMLTERLLLRRPNESDLGAIVDIVGDWEVARRLARVPHPYSPKDAKFFLEEIVPREWVWATTLRDSPELVGMVGLTPEAGESTAELGYWLDRAHWGNGIATEAARAVLTYGFETLRLSSITSGYFENNPASGRVLEKLGFVETGRTMRPCLATEAEGPSVRMRLLPSQ